MKPGDRFLISHQIGNVTLHKPSTNIAKIVAFVGSDVLIQIGNNQYILPINIFENYIVEKIEDEKVSTMKRAEFDVFTITETKSKPVSTSEKDDNESIDNNEADEPQSQQETDSSDQPSEDDSEDDIYGDDLYGEDDLYGD